MRYDEFVNALGDMLIFASCAVMVSLALSSASCMPRGSSFETLGVPPTPRVEGKAALVLGWAKEHREGWTIDRIKLDGRLRSEWDRETQMPAVIYISPGTRWIRLYTSKRLGGTATEAHRQRRVKLRPLAVVLEEGDSRICSVHTSRAGRRRPQMRCQRAPNLDADHIDRLSNDEAQRSDEHLRGQATHPHDNRSLDAALERLDRIEKRLDSLELALQTQRRANDSREVNGNEPSSQPPESAAQFESSFDSDTFQKKGPSKSWPGYRRFDEHFDSESPSDRQPIKVDY